MTHTLFDGKEYPKKLMVEAAPYMPAGSRFKVVEVEIRPEGIYYSLGGPAPWLVS